MTFATRVVRVEKVCLVWFKWNLGRLASKCAKTIRDTSGGTSEDDRKVESLYGWINYRKMRLECAFCLPTSGEEKESSEKGREELLLGETVRAWKDTVRAEKKEKTESKTDRWIVRARKWIVRAKKWIVRAWKWIVRAWKWIVRAREENVRAKKKDSAESKNYLWFGACDAEDLSSGENGPLGLALIVDDRVEKDGIYSRDRAKQELEHAVSWMQNHSKAWGVHCDENLKPCTEELIDKWTEQGELSIQLLGKEKTTFLQYVNDEVEKEEDERKNGKNVARRWKYWGRKGEDAIGKVKNGKGDKVGKIEDLPRLRKFDDIEEIEKWRDYWARSVFGWLKDVAASIFRAWKLILLIVLIGAALYGSYRFLFRSCTGPDCPKEENGGTTPVSARQEYAALLRGSRASADLLVAYAAYRDFVADPAFSAFAAPTGATWAGNKAGTGSRSVSGRNREPILTITSRILVDDEKWGSHRAEMRRADDFRRGLVDYGRANNWRVSIDEALHAERTFRLQPRLGVEDALADQSPQPSPEEGGPTMGLDVVLDYVGTVCGELEYLSRCDEFEFLSLDANRVYRTTQFALQLPLARWLDEEVVAWVARALEGAPIVLDSIDVKVDTVNARTEARRRARRREAPDPVSAAPTGIATIAFRLVWCVEENGMCQLTAADFESPELEAPS